jgi:hypothetical protein
VTRVTGRRSLPPTDSIDSKFARYRRRPAGLVRYSDGRAQCATRRGPIRAQPESGRQSGDRRGGIASQATADRSAIPGTSEHAKRRVAPKVMRSEAGGTASAGAAGVVVLCPLRSGFTEDQAARVRSRRHASVTDGASAENALSPISTELLLKMHCHRYSHIL